MVKGVHAGNKLENYCSIILSSILRLCFSVFNDTIQFDTEINGSDITYDIAIVTRTTIACCNPLHSDEQHIFREHLEREHNIKFK